MIREEKLIIGTKQEIKEHLNKKYRIQDVQPEKLSKGIRYFNSFGTFDEQISDTFTGNTVVMYIEVVAAKDSSLISELKIIRCAVHSKTSEQMIEETKDTYNKEIK